jgi:hypothetical protein
MGSRSDEAGWARAGDEDAVFDRDSLISEGALSWLTGRLAGTKAAADLLGDWLRSGELETGPVGGGNAEGRDRSPALNFVRRGRPGR